MFANAFQRINLAARDFSFGEVVMMRPDTRQSRGRDSAEKRYHHWIKDRGVCACCGNDFGVYLHHMYGSAFKFKKLMLGHLAVLGLCQMCDDVVTRGSRKAFTDRFGPQCVIWLKQLSEYPLRAEIRCDEVEAIMGYGK